MTTNWVADIHEMHRHFGHTEAFVGLTPEQLHKLLTFRISFLYEEMSELMTRRDSPEEVVDACIDLCVVAIGTLDAFGVDAQGAWDEVLAANMAKRSGVNPTRPNELGLPDLVKPDGWSPPSHAGNHGRLTEAV